MAEPLVTAIIPTKNRPELLQRAMRSVSAQSYPNLEIVVIDDGSADQTRRVIEDFATVMPFTYLRNEVSKGASAARNQGIERAKGTFIAGLDDDDEWHRDRISKMMQVYTDEYACVTSDVRMVYEKGEVVWHKKKVISLQNLLYSNQVGNQVLVKRDRLLEIGGFDESLEAAQDYDLWLRLCERFGPIRNVQEPLQNIYVDHEGEQISNPKSQLAGYLSFYKKHKSKMNRAQRKYQLFNIRRAQGKASGIKDMLRWVPPRRFFKDFKRWVAGRFLEK